MILINDKIPILQWPADDPGLPARELDLHARDFHTFWSMHPNGQVRRLPAEFIPDGELRGIPAERPAHPAILTHRI
jgi:hypothetical protein